MHCFVQKILNDYDMLWSSSHRKINMIQLWPFRAIVQTIFRTNKGPYFSNSFVFQSLQMWCFANYNVSFCSVNFSTTTWKCCWELHKLLKNPRNRSGKDYLFPICVYSEKLKTFTYTFTLPTHQKQVPTQEIRKKVQ